MEDEAPVGPSDDEAPDDLPDESIDWFSIDLEASRPGIPWRPPVGLLLAVAAVPVLSLLAAGPLADRLSVESPDQLWLVDLWRSLAIVTLMLGSGLAVAVPIAARLARGRPAAILAIVGVDEAANDETAEAADDVATRDEATED